MTDPATARPATIGRVATQRGEVVLRRRGTTTELIVNGAFLMDTVDTSTEELLARAALERCESPERVVVAGLGLGFTVGALLRDDRVRRIDVVELEEAIVGWVREGRVPPTSAVLLDPRVRTHVADFLAWLPDRPDRSADVVLLDVDNGPGFLVHEQNAVLYQRPFLAELARVLRPDGVLVVWSAAPAPDLSARLAREFGTCAEIRETVRREGRKLDYYLYAATVHAT